MRTSTCRVAPAYSASPIPALGCGVVLKLILGERVPVCLPLSFQTSPLFRASVRGDISATNVPELAKSLKRKVMR